MIDSTAFPLFIEGNTPMSFLLPCEVELSDDNAALDMGNPDGLLRDSGLPSPEFSSCSSGKMRKQTKTLKHAYQ
jgi:hypothetical protein